MHADLMRHALAVLLAVPLALLSLPAAAEFKPAVVFDTPAVEDGTFSQAALEGARQFERLNGVAVTTFVPDQPHGAVDDLMRRAAQAGHDPIVGVGFAFAPVIAAIAPEFPNAHFVLIDAVVTGANIRSIVFREEQGSFLVGYLAAMATRSKTLGFVGGRDSELIRKFACGYAQGALLHDPKIKVSWAMIGTTGAAFAEPDRGAELAKAQIAQGADVVYHAAGLSGDGVIRAAAAAGVYAIGVDRNQNGDAPGHMLTSMLKRVDVAVYRSLTDAAAGGLNSGTTSLGLREEAVGWALDAHNVTLISDDMQDAMERLTFDIAAGVVQVHTYTDADGCPYLDFGGPAGR